MKSYYIYFILGIGLLLIAGCKKDNGIKKHIIASIPEASGISYCENSDTLVVANDEGKLYEITTDGKILREKNIGKYDLEGVVCEEKRFIFVNENGDLLSVDRDTLVTTIFPLIGFDELSKKSGIEGITKVESDYLLTVQSKDKEKAKFLKVNIKEGNAVVKSTIHHGISDSAGLEYKDGNLYIVSDTKDKLYIYNLQSNKIVKKIELPKFAVEGVAIDNNGNIYFADDNGAILKYTLKELGITI